MRIFLGVRPALAAFSLLLPLACLTPALADPVPPGKEGELGKLLPPVHGQKVLCGWLPRCKGGCDGLACWSGAVLCPACSRGHRPLALMVSADEVPFCFAGFDALDIPQVVLVPGLTGSPSCHRVLATSFARCRADRYARLQG